MTWKNNLKFIWTVLLIMEYCLWPEVPIQSCFRIMAGCQKHDTAYKIISFWTWLTISCGAICPLATDCGAEPRCKSETGDCSTGTVLHWGDGLEVWQNGVGLVVNSKKNSYLYWTFFLLLRRHDKLLIKDCLI